MLIVEVVVEVVEVVVEVVFFVVLFRGMIILSLFSFVFVTGRFFFFRGKTRVIRSIISAISLTISSVRFFFSLSIIVEVVVEVVEVEVSQI